MVGTNQDEIMDTDITDLGAISFNKENKIKADKYFKMLFWHDGYNDAVTWVHSTSLVYLVFRDLKPKNEDEKPNASRAELDAIFIVNYWKENGLVDSFNSNPLKIKDTIDKLFKEHKIDNNSYEELNKSIESERRRHVNRIARTFFEKRDIKLRLYDYIKLTELGEDRVRKDNLRPTWVKYVLHELIQHRYAILASVLGTAASVIGIYESKIFANAIDTIFSSLDWLRVSR